jgi:3-phosphoshikimate 1-carboxyvinyltransferase
VTKTITRFPSGVVTVPPSKSVYHRVLICRALAGMPVEIPDVSDDIDATARCLSAYLSGGETLDCGESGSTLRFLVPLMAALGYTARFTGRGRLLERPMEPFLDELRRHGADITREPDAITVAGRLQSGEFSLRGDISSQFVTGLLLALPTVRGDSVIHLTSPLESRSYVDITLDVMAKFGVTATVLPNGDYAVAGEQTYRAADIEIEGDFSQAAFFLAAQALGRDIDVRGLDYNSVQGDKKILEIIRDAAHPDGALRAVDVDASDIPDLVPPVAAMLACADGVSRIYNAGRLRHKESDRLAAVSEELNALGADVCIDGDALVIHGKPRLAGGHCNSRNDHRIAMMCAVAAIRCDNPVVLENAECVAKSFPDFWEKFEVSA